MGVQLTFCFGNGNVAGRVVILIESENQNRNLINWIITCGSRIGSHWKNLGSFMSWVFIFKYYFEELGYLWDVLPHIVHSVVKC